MSTKPLLSVCLITYNHEAFIGQAIDSVLMQETDFSWQLIIADDHSTDGTRDILKAYEQKHPGRIHLILQPKNIGPEANWLDLLAYPKTKYVLYGEGDDFISDPHKLQAQVDFLQAHPDHALCFHPVRVFYENGEQPDAVFPDATSGFTVKNLLKHNFMQTNSVMYRWQFTSTNIKDIYPKGIAPGDWFLHLYHAQFGKIGFLPQVMSAYRRHAGGAWWDSHQSIDKIWLKHGLAHLKLYVVMLAMFGSTKQYELIVRAHIATLLDTLLQVDKAHGTELFQQASLQFPHHVSRYALDRSHMTKHLATTEAMLKQRTQDVLDSGKVIASRDIRIAALEEQIRLIKNSRLWRARSKAVGLAKKLRK